MAEVTTSRRRHFLSLLLTALPYRLTPYPCGSLGATYPLTGSLQPRRCYSRGPGVAFQPVKATPLVAVALPVGPCRAYGLATRLDDFYDFEPT